MELIDINYCSLWQDQYAFIHDAVLEALICGDTRIPASDLRQAVERLTQTNEESGGKTGFEQEFQVIRVYQLKVATADRIIYHTSDYFNHRYWSKCHLSHKRLLVELLSCICTPIRTGTIISSHVN